MDKELVGVPFKEMRMLIEKEDKVEYTDYEEVDTKVINETVSQEIEIVPIGDFKWINDYKGE